MNSFNNTKWVPKVQDKVVCILTGCLNNECVIRDCKYIISEVTDDSTSIKVKGVDCWVHKSSFILFKE